MESKSANKSLDMVVWSEIVNNWNKTTESQKVYCARLGININTFVYARNKLRKQEMPSAQFASLKVIPSYEDKTIEQPKIILENNRGYKLYFPASLSLELLIKLFKLSGWSDA
jgi:predicted enzyme involved in methoxymalonyl-ACP biosynthesis